MRKIFSTLVVAVLATTGIVVGVNQADAAPYSKPVVTGINLPASLVTPPVHTGYKPSVISFSVDGSYKIQNVHWKSWGAHKAVGYGVARWNRCTPYCAASASFEYTPVSILVSHPKNHKFTMSDIEATGKSWNSTK